MLDQRKRTVFLGVAFVVLLALSSIENVFFFDILTQVLSNEFIAVGMLFVHNILVISLILLGMAFYVNLVMLGFFRRERHANIVLEHSRTFALAFTIIVIFLSLLRGSSLLGGIVVEVLPLVLAVSAPIGIIEGYGIYLTIEKTLSRTMSMRGLIYIYGIFLVAAIMEVCFIDLLKWVTG